ncbi:MAG: hypothetical protein AAGH67_06975 [Cyanobacteria bacterium P01_H01_bin.162]
MTPHHPRNSTREQYTSYFPNAQTSGAYPTDFAPPSRPTRVMPHPPVARSQPSRAAAPRRSRAAQPPRRSRQAWLAGGGMLALAALVVVPKPSLPQAEQSASANVVCQETIKSESVLSRAELSKLLAIAERAPKADIQAVIDEPYCTLPPVNVREGVVSNREAYPLEFNPQTWFIVLYEDGEYAGFDFSFERD